METTNGIMNTTLYKYIMTTSVLSWIRTIVSNRMAKDTPSSINIFSKYNSATYNNPSIVTDLNKFNPGNALPPNTLWILEQIPGQVMRFEYFLLLYNYFVD